MSDTERRLPRIPFEEGIEERLHGQSQPAVVNGWFDSRPKLRQWSFDDFRERFSDRTITAGLTENGKLVIDEKKGVPQIELTFGEYLDRMQSGKPDCYLLSPVHERIPELLEEVDIPPTVRDSLWSTARLWVSAGDTISGLHRDWPENFFIQVEGRKKFYLIDRREKRYVYSRPFYSSAPNFSLVDAENPDYERFPEFRKATIVSDVIEAGEVLYLPRLWWHQVQSLDPSISLNLWYGRGMVGLVGKLSGIYAKIRGLRS